MSDDFMAAADAVLAEIETPAVTGNATLPTISTLDLGSGGNLPPSPRLPVATAGAGRRLADRLGLKIVRTEGNDLRVACVHGCGSSDNGHIDQDSGVYNCWSCGKGLSPLDLCKVVLGAGFEAAKQAMIDAGLWQDLSSNGRDSTFPAVNNNGKPSPSPADEAAFLKVCQLKRVPPDAWRKFGAKASKGGVVIPMYGPDKQVSSAILITPKNGKGIYAKGKRVGLFLPGRFPAPGESWLIVEGPKDAGALVALGYVACGLPGNSMNEKFAPLFKDVDVTIIPDVDANGAGEKGAAVTIKNLQGAARSVRKAGLPIDSGDVRDAIEKAGPEAVRAAIDAAAVVNKVAVVSAAGSAVTYKDVEPETVVKALDQGNYGTVLEDRGESCLVHFEGDEGEADVELSKSLSDNPCCPQGDDGELKMQEAKIIADFLLPPDQQTTSPVRPRVGTFDDPTPGLAVPRFFGRSLVVLARNVVDVAASRGRRAYGVRVIAFVGTEMLTLAFRRPWAWNRDASQGLTHQGLIMRIGTIHRDSQRYALPIGEHRPFDAQFAAIGRVFPGFFPRPAAPWSSPRPNFATASRCPSGHHILPTRVPTTSRRRRVAPIPESKRGWRCRSRTRWAWPSTVRRCIERRRCRWPRFASTTVGVLPWAVADTLVTTVPCAPKAHRELGETLMYLCRTLKPSVKARKKLALLPLREPMAMCSVIG